jgi:hypothetical protein
MYEGPNEPYRPKANQSRPKQHTALIADQNNPKAHNCPLGVVLNPFWLKVVSLLLAGIGTIGFFAAQVAYNAYANTAAKVALHDQVIAQIQYVQASQTSTQDRMETKLDRLFDIWHQPNPAPKPETTIVMPVHSNPLPVQ